MKIKVCGITREIDIVKLLELPVDFIGFNLLLASKRAVSISWALQMIDRYSLQEKAVFLVDYQDTEQMNFALNNNFRLQIYNCNDYSKITNKLFMPVNATFLKQLKKQGLSKNENNRYLVDNMEGALGGTGQKFNWDLLKEMDVSNIMIAGGIAPDDLSVLKNLEVWGIDINSKFESRPGIKDHKKLDVLKEYE
tara:strand:+ start:13 stop:594 length:582 start_codon:yes stop_codon:yes gene_type:complete